MKAALFAEAREPFILKQGAEGLPVALRDSLLQSMPSALLDVHLTRCR